MFRAFGFPILLGIAGVSILFSLGFWQLKRLAWKESILLEIETKIIAEPISVPKQAYKSRDQYLSVIAEGEFVTDEIHVLTSIKFDGPGFRIIAPFLLNDGRLIMVDRGFVRDFDKLNLRPIGKDTIYGNLLWPDETDRFIPKADIASNIWFARDVALMADYLKTQPILLVSRKSASFSSIRPQPVGINIPNDHLEYALTWFLLGMTWFGMTMYLIFRIRNKSIKF